MRKKKIYKKQAHMGKFSEIHKLLCEYDQYLDHNRGLALGTRKFYCDYIRNFLYFQFKSNKAHIKHVHPKDVFSFILSYAKNKGAKQTVKMISSLRSFFRFLTQTHKLKKDLADSIPKVANWRQTYLPASLTADEMQKLLLSCDRTCVLGLRDYAVLMLLIYLGLRSCEVVNLTLDNVDWNNGEIIIQGKGSTIMRLPINCDLINALASYLQHRPNCSSRSFFIGVNKPLKGFQSHCAVNHIVRSALKRAGLTPAQKGAHLLRHSFATQLLRQGATLQEIGAILRHKSIQTTAIYARVDFDKLRLIALPWPRRRKKGGLL
jgi:integrase/recombinase XerD